MSGGTTGMAQGRARNTVRTPDRQAGRRVDGSVLRGHEDVWLVPLPLFHVCANVGVQAVAFANGATLA
jgi:hypothetical protein